MRIRPLTLASTLPFGALLVSPASHAGLGAGVFDQRCYIDVPPVQVRNNFV